MTPTIRLERKEVRYEKQRKETAAALLLVGIVLSKKIYLSMEIVVFLFTKIAFVF
jgi:hypothetical protein